MGNQTIGRPWTVQEDQQLIQAVSTYGDNTEKWKTIALAVPGRTNKACRKRWLHSLCPTVKKTAWTPEEDQLLLSLYSKYSTKWSVIARNIPGRTDDACSKRYREALDPSLKKAEWTDEEDTRLLECYARLGGKWGQVGQELQRSGLGCRNRWRLLERKKNTVSRQTQAGPPEAMPILTLHPNAWPSSVETISTTYSSERLDQTESCNGVLDPALDDRELPAFDHLQSLRDTVTSIAVNEDDGIHDVGEAIVHQSRSSSPLPFSYSSSSLSAALSDPQGRDQTIVGVHTFNIPHASMPTMSPAMGTQPLEAASVDHNVEIHFTDDSGQETSNSPIFSRQPSTLPEPCPQFDVPERIDATDFPSYGYVTQASTDVPVSYDLAPLDIHSYASNSSAPSPRSMQSVFSAAPNTTPRKRQRVSVETVSRVSSRVNGKGRSGKTQDLPTLSSTLPATPDASVLAYVCGHPGCWLLEENISSFRSATSGELSDHFKDQHMDGQCGNSDTPFRCGLEGCKKGWKSVNGLQYHLQISKAHFRQALSSAALTTSAANDHPAPSSVSDFPSSGSLKTKKLHSCPHPDCSNRYKQVSGLRYHLAHGHPQDLPAQLDVVPPTLARRLTAEKNGRPSHYP